MSGILGRKLGMTRIIQDDGRVIPITVVECEPSEVLQVKTVEKDGYPAIVLGFSAYNKATKTKKFKHVKEFRVAESNEYKKGDKVTIEIFEDGESVHVTSKAKGKGFQGGIKRHNFSRGPESHGSHHHREIGSIGACAAPGRVIKGKKMPGRMGGQQITLKKVSIAYKEVSKNLIGIKGSVPGARNSLVIINKEN